MLLEALGDLVGADELLLDQEHDCLRLADNALAVARNDGIADIGPWVLLTTGDPVFEVDLDVLIVLVILIFFCRLNDTFIRGLRNDPVFAGAFQQFLDRRPTLYAFGSFLGDLRMIDQQEALRIERKAALVKMDKPVGIIVTVAIAVNGRKVTALVHADTRLRSVVHPIRLSVC
jgi:hypothetical protein